MYEDHIPSWWNLMRRPPHWVMHDHFEKAVTVRVDERTFSNLKSMQSITAQTLGRLGCGECHSGFDIRYLLERDFFVNPAGEVLPADTGYQV